MHSPLFSVKKILKAVSLMPAVTAFLFVAGCGSETEEDSCERTSYLMNTMVVQQWYGEEAQQAADDIEAALSEFEKSKSLYIEGSEIDSINDSAGKEDVVVSDETFELLLRAKKLCAESGGEFDITIGPLTTLWDVAGNKGDPSVPDSSDIEAALEKVDFEKLTLTEDTSSAMLEEAGMLIDLGGIAKGYAASLMREIAQEHDVSGYLFIGGNMMVLGKKQSGEDFVVGVRDPRKDSNSYLATITLDGYTMASSSAAEIYFEQDGVKYHHILDPKTGYPGETDLLQVSVVSEDGLLADALSTTIFLKGSACLDEYMNRDDCMVLAVTQDCEVYGSPDIWEIVTPVSTDDYTFIQ